MLLKLRGKMKSHIIDVLPHLLAAVVEIGEVC